MELQKSGLSFKHLPEKNIEKLGNSTLNLINLIGVDTSRDTHYGKKEDMELARKKFHNDVFSIDRGIYAAVFCMPGVIEFARQGAIKALLSNPRYNGTQSVINTSTENLIISKLLRELQPNKVLNTFVEMVDNKVNNSRTRRNMLTYIFTSPSLELWAVKYKPKILKVLTHCWNLRYKNIVKAILSTSTGKLSHRRLTGKEMSYLNQDFLRFKNPKLDETGMMECVAFILGIKGPYKTRMLKAYEDSKKDIKAGSILPYDILDGIRSTYHPDVTKAQLLEMTKRRMTHKQRKLVQSSAKKAGVAITFNPMTQPMTDLFIYSYKMGMSKDVRNAIQIKAKRAAQTLPFHYGKIGIVFDSSISMSGSKTQQMRPISVASATKEMLKYACEELYVERVGGLLNKRNGLIYPEGDSCLAIPFVKIVEKEPDAIFIISDGYENVPSGRTFEVIEILKRLGFNTPIYHINPVAASESKVGVRQLSDNIPVMPISKPEAVGLTFFKPMLEVDPLQGLKALMNMVLPLLEGPKKRREVRA